jgi:hypothetical protein
MAHYRYPGEKIVAALSKLPNDTVGTSAARNSRDQQSRHFRRTSGVLERKYAMYISQTPSCTFSPRRKRVEGQLQAPEFDDLAGHLKYVCGRGRAKVRAHHQLPPLDPVPLDQIVVHATGARPFLGPDLFPRHAAHDHLHVDACHNSSVRSFWLDDDNHGQDPSIGAARILALRRYQQKSMPPTQSIQSPERLEISVESIAVPLCDSVTRTDRAKVCSREPP